MSFLNKLKKGVSEAGAMAKVTVEVNRLKLQISSIKKEITELQTSIGKLVYEQHTNEIDHSSEITSICEQIKAKYDEIEVIEQKMIEVSGEKKCECGATVPIDTRFCSECGHHFAEVVSGATSSAAAEEILTIDNGTSKEVEEALLCQQCSQPVEADAKFCEHCGTATN